MGVPTCDNQALATIVTQSSFLQRTYKDKVSKNMAVPTCANQALVTIVTQSSFLQRTCKDKAWKNMVVQSCANEAHVKNGHDHHSQVIAPRHAAEK